MVERRVIRGPRQTRLPFFLAALLRICSMRQIGAHLANGCLDHASAVDEMHLGKACAEVPPLPGMRMGFRFHGAGFGPGEQFVGGDGAFAHLQMLLRIVGDTLSQLVGMRQKKVNVEGACLIEHEGSGIKGGSYVNICSSLVSLAPVKEQVRGASGLAHPVLLLMRTKCLGASSFLTLRLVVHVFLYAQSITH